MSVCVCIYVYYILVFVLGLTHLIGSALLRAYMHGFFMDIRLYHKVLLMTVFV